MRHTTIAHYISILIRGWRSTWRARGFSRLALLMLGILLVFGLLSGASSDRVARAGTITDGPDKSSKDISHDPGILTATPTQYVGGPETEGKTPTAIVNMTPIPEQGLMGWERESLRDLAEVVGWPTAVNFDANGRLKVQAYDSLTNWSVAHIRAFDFDPGANAAFMAEQEDTRLAGFSLSTEYFYGYRAYS